MQRLDTATKKWVRNSPLKYLVGTIDRWNDGKRCELKDRSTSVDLSDKQSNEYVSADELVQMGELQTVWKIEPPDWMVNHYEVINNAACACVSKSA